MCNTIFYSTSAFVPCGIAKKRQKSSEALKTPYPLSAVFSLTLPFKSKTTTTHDQDHRPKKVQYNCNAKCKV